MGLSKEERRLRIRRRIRKTVSELLMHLASLSLEVTKRSTHNLLMIQLVPLWHQHHHATKA